MELEEFLKDSFRKSSHTKRSLQLNYPGKVSDFSSRASQSSRSLRSSQASRIIARADSDFYSASGDYEILKFPERLWIQEKGEVREWRF